MSPLIYSSEAGTPIDEVSKKRFDVFVAHWIEPKHFIYHLTRKRQEAQSAIDIFLEQIAS
jgi:hypothetical protein